MKKISVLFLGAISLSLLGCKQQPPADFLENFDAKQIFVGVFGAERINEYRYSYIAERPCQIKDFDLTVEFNNNVRTAATDILSACTNRIVGLGYIITGGSRNVPTESVQISPSPSQPLDLKPSTHSIEFQTALCHGEIIMYITPMPISRLRIVVIIIQSRKSSRFIY